MKGGSVSPPTDRVIAVIGLLAAAPGREFTLADLIRETGISRATCHSIARRLVDSGYLLRTPGGYTLGPALIAVGRAAERSFPAVRAAHRCLPLLAEEFGVPCTAAVHDAETITVVDAAAPRLGVDAVRIGRRIPLVPPFGAVQVAWSSSVEVEAWLARAASEEQRSELRQVIRLLRKRGYDVHRESDASARLRGALAGLEQRKLPQRQQAALEALFAELSRVDVLPDQFEPEQTYSVNAISAPVFDRFGRTSLVLSLLVARQLTGAEIEAAGRRLVEVTGGLTTSTGGNPPCLQESS